MTLTTLPPKNGNTFLVLIYLRVSMDDTRTGSHTFETQMQRIVERLDATYGPGNYEAVTLQDNGVSGGYGPQPTGVEKRTRPGLQKVVAELATGRYDGFIVYDLSRLARSARWFFQLLEDTIIPAGVTLMSAVEEIDVQSIGGRLQAGIISLVNEAYRDNVRKRNRDAAATRASAGYYVGQVGYGWEWEPLADVPLHGRRRILPVESERVVVVQMKDWYLSGWSLPKIARELNRRREPSPSGKGQWSFATVRNTVMNPVHAGLIPSRAGLQVGEHNDRRFFDPEVLDRLTETRKSRPTWNKTNTAKAVHNLLAGFACCARCGHRLYVARSKDPAYRAYRCENGQRQGQRTCPDVSVRADALEAAVAAEIERMAQDPIMQAMLLAEAEAATGIEDERLTERVRQLRARLASYDEKFRRWALAYTEGAITTAQMREYNGTMSAERAEAETELAEAEGSLANRSQREAMAARVRATVLDFPTVWSRLHLDERRQVLSCVLERLTVDRDEDGAVMAVKVQLLPERTAPIRVNRKKRGSHKQGVAALTERQMAFLYHISQGLTVEDAGKAMGVQSSGAHSFAQYARKHTGVHDLKEAAEVARPRILANLPHLPLGPDPDRQPGETAAILSPTLMEVFPLFASGAKAREVAEMTGLPVGTVRGRKAKILQALGAKSTFDAAQKARAMGLLQ
jgi:DNA invertase Pin-like site-specific DNA recombinase